MAYQGTIEELESWRFGHKSRSVSVHIDNGYGATCWVVELRGNNKKVLAAEVAFYEGEYEQAPREYVFVASPDDELGDWPGLAKTLAAALERADELGL